jgi:hypothetical protein
MALNPAHLAWKLVCVVLLAWLGLRWVEEGAPAGDPWSTEARLSDRVAVAQAADARGDLVVLVAGTSTLGFAIGRDDEPDTFSPRLAAVWPGDHVGVTAVSVTWTNLTLAGSAHAWPALMAAEPALVVLQDEFVFPPLALRQSPNRLLRPFWSTALPSADVPRTDLAGMMGPADLDGPGLQLALRTIAAQQADGRQVVLVQAPRSVSAAAAADPLVEWQRNKAVQALCDQGATCIGRPAAWPDHWFYDHIHLLPAHRARYQSWLVKQLTGLL